VRIDVSVGRNICFTLIGVAKFADGAADSGIVSSATTDLGSRAADRIRSQPATTHSCVAANEFIAAKLTFTAIRVSIASREGVRLERGANRRQGSSRKAADDAAENLPSRHRARQQTSDLIESVVVHSFAPHS
jgi:hypothetical protein